MEDKVFVIDGFTVQYGKTTARELVNRGYLISGFEQSIKEPVLVSCNLSKDDELVAILWFYEINEKICLEQLYDIPIDLILLEERPHRKYERQEWGVSKRIFFSCLIHVIVAAFFAFMFSDLARREWLRYATVGRHEVLLSITLIAVPAAMIAVMWGGNIIGKKGNLSKKILLSLGALLNFCISLAYVLLIYYKFVGSIWGV